MNREQARLSFFSNSSNLYFMFQVFKDAGEFFDNVSNAEAEPTTTDDVVFEKAISKTSQKLTPQSSDSSESRKSTQKAGKLTPQNSDSSALSKIKLNHQIQIKRVKKEISEQITLNESPKDCDISSDTDLDLTLDLGDNIPEEGVQMKLVQDILTNIRSDRSGDEKEVETEKSMGSGFQLDKLGEAIDSQASITIEKLRMLVRETLKRKTTEVEALTKENETLLKAKLLF